MGNNKKYTPEEIVVLEKDFNTKKAAFEALGDDVDEAVKTTAKEAADTAGELLETAKVNPVVEKPEGKTKKIKFLLAPAGRFLLSYNVGQVVSIPKDLSQEQADELVEAKFAEYVK